MGDFTYIYEYDDITGNIIKKKNKHTNTNSYSGMELNYVPSDSDYLSTKIQNTNNYFYTPDAFTNSNGENSKTSYKNEYKYDNNENITKITLEKITPETSEKTKVNYCYDDLNRLSAEEFDSKRYEYKYQKNNKDINKITTVSNNGSFYKKIEYDDLGRMTKYSKFNTSLQAYKEQKEYTYETNYLNPKSITKNNITYNCTWIRDNLLSEYGDIKYEYNHQGQRRRKMLGDTQLASYYYDGSKLIGEDGQGIKLRYIYDMLGITGVRYTRSGESMPTDYQYAKDGQGNVIAVIKDGLPVVEYTYDTYGNYEEKIINQYDPFAKINPIRWRSQYYDLETGMYYINSRYYDPEVYQYFDSLDIERIIESMDTIGGLNLHAVCSDNPIDLDINRYNILTSQELTPDPYYDPTNGVKSSIWKKFKLVLKALIVAAITIVAIVLITNPATSCFGIGLLKAALISGLIKSVLTFCMTDTGEKGFFKENIDDIVSSFLDGFIEGAIYYCVATALGIIKPGNCFIAGTLILTESGRQKIESIEIGDQVWAYNEETGENELKEVVHIFRNKTEEWIHVHINDEHITCTKEHPFYIPDLKQWINAGELELGMNVLLSSGDYDKITSLEVEHLDTPETTYNFEVRDLHNYYVGESNVLVHNTCVVDTPVDDLMNFESAAKLESHYAKHGHEFNGLYQSADDYLAGANNVIKHGTKVNYLYKGEIRTGYAQFFGNSAKNGMAKFAFVGTNNSGFITTFHVERSKELFRLLGTAGIL